MKPIEIILSVLVLLLGASLLVVLMHRPQQQQYGSIFSPIYAPQNIATVTCPVGSSVLALATSTSRQNLIISNVSGATTTPHDIELGYGRSDVSTSTGATLFASSTREMNQNNLFSGAIYCTGIGGPAALSISEAK